MKFELKSVYPKPQRALEREPLSIPQTQKIATFFLLNRSLMALLGKVAGFNRLEDFYLSSVLFL